MKRQIFLSALVLLAAGCASNNEINEPLSQKEVTITASFAESQTRTIIADNGTDVYWEKGDEIKMFWGTGGSKFTSTLTKSAAVSDFEGTLPTIIGGTEGISAESKLMALYPYSSDATSDGKSITTTLPDVQDARAGSFAKKLNLSIAESNTFFMGFYNVCSGVCFKLATAGIKQVSIKSNKDEALAGKIKVAFEDGVPAVQDITEAKDSITLFPPTGSTFSTDVWYYIVTLPGTLTGGLTFTFKTDTQYATLTSTKSLELRRGIFGRVSGFDAKLTWKNLYGGGASGENIDFEDVNVKKACVAKFDTDRDGEISIDEAAAVTDLSGLLDDYKTITSFDELQYFTKVTELPKGLFSGCSSLTSVTLPSSLETIGAYCFSGCLKLNNIDIPRTVKTIGEYCFNACAALTSLNISGNISSIGEYCFNGCQSLSSLKISGSITSLPAYFIKGCKSLKSFTIPETVKYLYDYSFADSYIEELTIPNTVTSVRGSFLNGNPNIKKIDFDASARSIPVSCFQNCTSLTDVKISSSVTSLWDYCFYGCTSLTSIDIPSSVTSLGNHCFGDCTGLTSIEIPSSVTSLGAACFSGCTGLTSIVIPSSVTSLGVACFFGCGLTSIEIPSSVTSLGIGCFRGCTGLTSIDIPSSVTSLGGYCFDGCAGLTSIDIPSSVTSLGEYCFRGCTGLTSIKIPSSVTSLGNNCFYGCKSLTSIEIPSSVTELGYDCFYNCTNLSEMRCLATSVPSVGNTAFSGTKASSEGHLYVPEASVELYANDTNWKVWKNIQKLQ